MPTVSSRRFNRRLSPTPRIIASLVPTKLVYRGYRGFPGVPVAMHLSIALVEFHQHAGNFDVEHDCCGVCIPTAPPDVSKKRCATVVIPPAVFYSAVFSTLVVVSIRSGEPHPVGNIIRISGVGECVAGVSVEPRHAQTKAVALRSNRKRRIFAPVPYTGVSLDLKTRPTGGECKDRSMGWMINLSIPSYVNITLMFMAFSSSVLCSISN